MLRTILVAVACLLGTLPCYGYVQPGALPDARAKAQPAEPSSAHEPQSSPHAGATTPRADRVPLGRADGSVDRVPVEVAPDETTGPSQPVPEPSVMLLTSMGLMALGVAMRRRRSS
jgi:hypothetical protein